MAEETKPTLGYPNIEKLIDSEDFNSFNDTFSKAYKTLDKLAKEKKGLPKAKEAKKIMDALEKVSELLKELLAMKYKIQEELAKTTKK